LSECQFDVKFEFLSQFYYKDVFLINFTNLNVLMDYLNQFSKFSVDFTNSSLVIFWNLHGLLLNTFYRKFKSHFLGVKLSQELKFHIKFTKFQQIEWEFDVFNTQVIFKIHNCIKNHMFSIVVMFIPKKHYKLRLVSYGTVLVLSIGGSFTLIRQIYDEK
jgi:hypothetical protein